VEELEERNAVERQQLMRVIFKYLTGSGVKGELLKEDAPDSIGRMGPETVIKLSGQKIEKIRLAVEDAFSCGSSEIVMRFQYEVHLDKELSKEAVENTAAETQLIREGKVLSVFGGKVVGVKWNGKSLAETLNADNGIADHLLKCTRSWSHLDYRIEAGDARIILINGPRFSNPGHIAHLYESNLKEEIESCVFGFPVMEKIAEHIKNSHP
jgi:hypothetical protein